MGNFYITDIIVSIGVLPWVAITHMNKAMHNQELLYHLLIEQPVVIVKYVVVFLF